MNARTGGRRQPLWVWYALAACGAAFVAVAVLGVVTAMAATQVDGVVTHVGSSQDKNESEAIRIEYRFNGARRTVEEGRLFVHHDVGDELAVYVSADYPSGAQSKAGVVEDTVVMGVIGGGFLLAGIWMARRVRRARARVPDSATSFGAELAQALAVPIDGTDGDPPCSWSFRTRDFRCVVDHDGDVSLTMHVARGRYGEDEVDTWSEAQRSEMPFGNLEVDPVELTLTAPAAEQDQVDITARALEGLAPLAGPLRTCNVRFALVGATWVEFYFDDASVADVVTVLTQHAPAVQRVMADATDAWMADPAAQQRAEQEWRRQAAAEA